MFLHQNVRSNYPKFLGSVLCLFLFLHVAAFGATTQIDIKPLWELHVDMVLEGSAMVTDLNGDGDDEILTAAYENIIVVDGTGKELWRFDSRGRYSTCPAILERENKSPLIYAADNTGMFTCLDGAGKVVWQIDCDPVFCASPAIADLDNDGKFEVIQGDKKGNVSAYNALTGARKWQQLVGIDCSAPAVGDLNGDGEPEIVIATGTGKVVALASAGKILWEFNVGVPSQDWATCSPVIFKNSTGQVCVVAGSQEGQFFCLDARGRIIWKRRTRGAIASTISVADFDVDGCADVFVVTQLGVLYRFDENGRVLWDIDTQCRSLAAGAIFDGDGDGALEYALCTQQGNLLVFSNAGEVVFNHQFNTRTINVTPVLGDIVPERPGLEMALTGGEGGLVYCLATPAPKNTPSPWHGYRGNNWQTAAWFDLASIKSVQMFPENLSWDQIFTGTEVTFRIENPGVATGMLKAEASCFRPDGSLQSAVGKVLGHHGLLKLPVTISAPGAYQFEWALSDAAGKILVQGARQLTLQPFLNDQSLVQRAILVLKETTAALSADQSPKGLKAALQQESQELRNEAGVLGLLQAAAPGATPEFSEKLNSRTAALNERARRALTLARVAESIVQNAPKSQFVAFEGIIWENLDVDRQLPSEVKIPLKIERRSVPGEHEPVSLKLLNVTLEPIAVECKIQQKSGKANITAFEVKPVPTNQKLTAWDPIVPLGKNKLEIPAQETREIWLDIDLADAVAGQQEIEVVLSTGKSESRVQMALEILPFEMAGYDLMRLCCWANYSRAAVKDLLAHGNTVFTCSLPPVKMTREEPLKLEIDFSLLDELTESMKGFDVYLLMSGIPQLGVPSEEAAYVPRLKQYLDEVFQYLAARGITEDNVALYPFDEPGGHGWDTVNKYIAFAKQGLKARPGLKFYVNGGGDVAMFEAFNEIAAIWCPGYYILSEDVPLINFLRKSGKLLWTYDCGYSYSRPIGANIKTINVAAQYRLPAMYAFTLGGTGIGYWCYNVGPSMWDPIELEYPLVYQNEDGTPTSSRRWEAVRESMEDTRILIALREKLNEPAVSAAAKAKIHHLLEEVLPVYATQSLNEAKFGVARYVLDASNNDATVEKLRKEILDCVELLRQ